MLKHLKLKSKIFWEKTQNFFFHENQHCNCKIGNTCKMIWYQYTYKPPIPNATLWNVLQILFSLGKRNDIIQINIWYTAKIVWRFVNWSFCLPRVSFMFNTGYYPVISIWILFEYIAAIWYIAMEIRRSLEINLCHIVSWQDLQIGDWSRSFQLQCLIFLCPQYYRKWCNKNTSI